jgi:hypothetical protein
VSKLREMMDRPSALAEMIGNLDKRPHKVIPFPGQPGRSVALWALSGTDDQAARKAAYEYVRSELKFSELDLVWEQQQAVTECVAAEVLSRALRDPENPERPFAASAQEVLERLSLDAIEALLIEYNKYASERYGLRGVKNAEKEVDALVDLLGKGLPITARLSQLDTPSLRRCLHSAVVMLSSSTTQSSSESLPPSDSPTTSSGDS